MIGTLQSPAACGTKKGLYMYYVGSPAISSRCTLIIRRFRGRVPIKRHLCVTFIFQNNFF